MARTLYFSNHERVAGDGPATGDIRDKVLGSASRFAFYPHRTIVIPLQPSQAYLAYVGSLGREAHVYVPTTLNPDRLSILDGLADPTLQRMLEGAQVESYIPDGAVFHGVTAHGAHYGNGQDPSKPTLLANDKARYAGYVADIEGLVVPPGTAFIGLMTIAGAVHTRLQRGLGSYVRHTLSGGGLGNRVFRFKQWSGASLGQITAHIIGHHPEMWGPHTVALVEDILNLGTSPGVAFHTESGILWDFVQLLRDGSYVGCYSPTPQLVCDPARLESIGDQLAAQLRQIDFHGPADTDLGTIDGRPDLVGFEINGRNDGVRHAVEAGMLLHGPWRDWRRNGVIMKALDVLHLKTPMTFGQVKQLLTTHDLLATPRSPWGVVVTIPPFVAGSPHDLAIGVAYFGRSYDAVDQLDEIVQRLLGNSTLNPVDSHGPLY